MLNVLIVDDDRPVRMFLEQLFKKTFRLPAKTAENGQIALDICANFVPDVICLDISMPILNGTSFVKEIKKDNRFDNTIIIIMSSENDKKTISELIQQGVRNFILKPFDYMDTQKRLKSILLPVLEQKRKEQDSF